MPRLVIVLPVTPLRDGDGFTVAEWPLHVTVLPPFLTDAPAAEIATAMAAVARTRPPVTVVAGDDELFGRRHDIPVTLIDPAEDLTGLHQALVAAIRPFAAEPDEPAFTGPGFRAHVTHKPPARLHPGDILTLTQLALVDMLPRAHAAGRTVLATTPLLHP
ncbi:2'-5' RNA ligase family protein [Cryobacterium sp. AP23]